MIEVYSLALPGAPAATEEIALAEMVEAYSTLLFRVAHSILRNRAESEDVVQDVFVRVMENQKSISGIRNMRVWLVRIAWNLAIDRRRRIRPEQMDEYFEQSLLGRERPADSALSEQQRMKAVLQEIERLPQAERQVILLSALDELGTAELSTIIGKSESAIRSLLFRARTRLRERLNERGDA